MPERPVPLYLCYKDFPEEYMLLKLIGTTPEAFEKNGQGLAKAHGVDSSTTRFVRPDGRTRSDIEGLMRERGLITFENERGVFLDMGNLGVP